MAKGAYIGALKEGHKLEYEAAFADNSWVQIIKACQRNEVPSTWAVGDQKPMDIGGNEYVIDIIGKHHDTYADGSGTAPLTFQLHDLYSAQKYKMNDTDTNSVGWTGSAMRNRHLPAILELMPQEVQTGIKEVNKLTATKGGNSSSIGTTADKLFLLSEFEIFGALNQTFAGEGTQYEYYAEGNSTAKRLAYGSGDNNWWGRSPCRYTTQLYSFVLNGSADTNYPTNSVYISFAFCFGGDSEINDFVARRAKKGYIGVPTLSESVGDLKIGSTVQLNVGGVATDFLVVHKGNPNSSLYDASCDGVWLLMKDIYETRAWSSAGSSAQYQTSTINTYLNGTFLSRLDDGVQNAIKQVKIPYVMGKGDETVVGGENGLPVKAFLLSGYEVGWTWDADRPGTNNMKEDGACLRYFAYAYRWGESDLREANYSGSTTYWYTRTPDYSNTTVYTVTTDGGNYTASVNTNYGVRPALILPYNLSCKNGFVDGTEAETKPAARKIKKAYIGAEADVPVYGLGTVTENITADNISEYFDVANDSYYFAGSGSVFTSNNGGYSGSTAKTTLTAKYNCPAISFSYSYSSEQNYDKFTLVVAGTTIENAVSGSTTQKTYSGALSAGDAIVFTYTKDGSQDKNDDKCTFSNMSVTAEGVYTQIGTEKKSVATLCLQVAPLVYTTILQMEDNSTDTKGFEITDLPFTPKFVAVQRLVDLPSSIYTHCANLYADKENDIVGVTYKKSGDSTWMRYAETTGADSIVTITWGVNSIKVKSTQDYFFGEYLGDSCRGTRVTVWG